MPGGKDSVVFLDGTDPAHLQFRWRAESDPVLTVDPGAVVEIAVPDSSTLQLTERSTREDLGRLDLDRVDAAVGPIAVRGAAPGDTLTVEILSLTPGTWGWSGIFRRFGLLKNRFDDDLVRWSIADGRARPVYGFLRPVSVPVRPMLGWIGVAPPSGELGMIPPRHFGGNLDNRLHGPGATAHLPVQRPGALLCVGDPHAAQGDGEVCGTGIETSAVARLRLGLRPGERLAQPRVFGPDRSAPGPRWAAMGVGPDLYAAAKSAVENLLDLLTERGLRAEEAYLLASVAGDLRISEIVDEPNFVVSAVFPADLLAADPPPGPPSL